MSLVCVLAAPLTAAAQPQFEENDDGYVVMEMESVPIPSGHDWLEESSLPEATGGAYYRFTGNDICNGPANSPLRYTFRIRTAGTYELRLRAARIWHCVEGMAEGMDNRCGEEDRTCDSLGEPVDDTCPSGDQCIRTDISNDSFMFVETAGGEYVAHVDQPDSSLGDPIKLFGGANNAWGWTGTRSLDTAGRYDAHWQLEPGDYTLVVQGRSQGFRIDRIVFFDTERGEIRGAEELPESRLIGGGMPDAGADSGADDAGTTADSGRADSATADSGLEPTDSGCGCRVASTSSAPAWPLAAMVLLGYVRRRSRRRR